MLFRNFKPVKIAFSKIMNKKDNKTFKLITMTIKINYSLKTTIQKAYITGMHLKDQLNHKNKILRLQNKSQRKILK